MEPDKVATIAALAVALVALLVASAQAIQQYFLSGQLIRLCDSVVYNRMPGQGRRIWQFSQFRFRVVYSIPQIHLLPEVRLNTSMHVQSLLPDAARLPPLSVQRSRGGLSALAGEASWVSFVRAVQYSAGESMRYTMVEGDADRCPSDLPVVPMQLSMRDVVVVAVMMGMECTDISFQSQSISMQGDAGTISSSRHPVLGALIHFAPKQSFANHGIRAQGGMVSSEWVGRMLDIVTVASQRFDLRDRKHFEEDEGSWIKASMTPGFMEQLTIGDSSPSSRIRRRRLTKRTSSFQDVGKSVANRSTRDPTERSFSPFVMVTDSAIPRRPQDGDWYLTSALTGSRDEFRERQWPRNSDAGLDRPGPYKKTLGSVTGQIRQLALRLGGQETSNSLPISEPKLPAQMTDPSPEELHAIATSTSHGNREHELTTHNLGNGYKNDLRLSHPKKRRRRATKLASVSNAHMEQDNSSYTGCKRTDDGAPPPVQNQLLLTDTAKDARHSDTVSWLSGTSSDLVAVHQGAARNDFVVGKWQRTFQQRRNERSRGRSQFNSERCSVLSLESTQSGRQEVSARDRSRYSSRHTDKHPKLAIQGLYHPKNPKQVSVNTNPNIDTSGERRKRTSRRRHALQRKSTDCKWDSTNSESGPSSASSTLAQENVVHLRNRRPIHHSRKKHRQRFDVGQGDSVEGSKSTRRGRRRNSSLDRDAIHLKAGYDLVYSDGVEAQDGDAVQNFGKDIENEGRVPSLGMKRVRLLLPETTTESSPSMDSEDRSRSNALLEQSRPASRGPREHFSEDTTHIRSGVTPAKASRQDDQIPPNARWTKIDRKLVNAEALERGQERYEEREGYVIVLRVLTRAEVEHYALQTQVIRALRVHGEDLSTMVAENRYKTATPRTRSFERERSGSPKQEPCNHVGKVERQLLKETTQPGGFSHQDDGIKDGASTTKRFMYKNDSKDSRANWNDTAKQQTENVDNECNREGYRATSDYGGNSNHEDGPTETRSILNANRPDAEQSEEYLGSLRQHSSLSRRTTFEIGIMTYDEEVLFLTSESILKKLWFCTEQCKDIITTLEFIASIQPEIESDVERIRDWIRDCNASLIALLTSVESYRADKKAAQVVVADLDVLRWSLQICLDPLQRNFDLFDIRPVTPAARSQIWKRMLGEFEQSFGCTMTDGLILAHKFETEVASNFKAGTFRSPESAMAKMLLIRTIGYDKSSRASLPPVAAAIPPASSPGLNGTFSFFRSPSRYMRSPSQSSLTGSPLEPGHRMRKNRSRSTGLPSEKLVRENKATPGDSIYEDQVEYSSDDGTESSASTLISRKGSFTGEVNWFWISQADVLPGFFATPWKTHFSCATCIGAISVLLKTIEEFTNTSNFRYVARQDYCKQWLHLGKTTYPSYAHNANGGVVVTGAYPSTIFDAFGKAVAPLELVNSYDFQVDRNYYSSTQATIDSAAEIMGLDSWLSMCGRLTEIVDGPGKLLQSMPTLVQQVMTDFDLEFSSVDRTSRDGGLRLIKTISDSLLQYLEEQNLSKAEIFFSIVALLRTAKMALCISRGTDTAKLRDVLLHDVQVYLA
ncbi:MAG: hypothetical protein Q9225_005363 [Loekoesia sp. 1 TL-2023]